MSDNRSDKVKKICNENLDSPDACEFCPLRKTCQTVPNDSKEKFDIRMNLAAEQLK